MKKVFVTFADSRLARSKERIIRQATNMDLYDQVIAFDETSLSKDFQNQFKSKLSGRIRGFGYWVWKPQVILQALKATNEGDIIQYTDVGCHLNPKGRTRLIEYFNMAQNSPSGLLTFQAFRPELPMKDDGREIPHWIDREWTKGDLLDYFDVRENEFITETPTIQSGVFFLRNQDSTKRLVQRWLETYQTSFSLADDSPSKTPNLPGFKEHRHDQAIFSILAKLGQSQNVSASEFWYPQKNGSLEGDWKYLEEFPILAKRDLDFGFFRNSLRKAKRLLKQAVDKFV